jgi:prepilin-type N-terminal cleavage/methylation domain-containing protein
MKSKKGFTLLEVLIAVVILGLAYVTILQSFSMSSSNLFKIDTQRGEIFDAGLQFEQALRNDESGVLKENVILDGKLYEVVQVKDESGSFVSYKLAKK